MDFEFPFSVIDALPIFVLGATAFAVWSFSLRIPTALGYQQQQQQQPAAVPHGEKLGVVDKSNIADEYRYKPEGEEEESVDSWSVKSLWIYPIKSCQGIELEEVNVIPTGFENDRQFMLAEWKQDQKTGEMKWTFMTQRQYPKMAQIITQVYVDRKSKTGGTLVVDFPAKPVSLMPSSAAAAAAAVSHPRSFQIPLNPNEKYMSQFPIETVGIWKDASNVGHNITSIVPPQKLAELVEFLNAKGKVALFRVCNSRPRQVFRCAPPKEELGYQPIVGFADAYPLHLLNIASVRDLGAKIEAKIPDFSCRRFRSNIIVSGPKAFDEDDWKVITLGQNIYHAACRTTRCLLPNVDPDAGVKHPQEPDKTMKSYRRIDEGAKTSACMGMQLVPAEKMGMLRVGDKVVVKQRGEHFTVW